MRCLVVPDISILENSRCGEHYCREILGLFLQQTFVKYMDTNGNYPDDWQLADSKQMEYRLTDGG